MIVGPGKKRAEMPAVVPDPADRNSGKRRAVIAAFAAYQPEAGPLSNLVEVAARDFQRGIDRLGTRIDEEHMIQSGRCQVGYPACDFKSSRVSELECRRVVECTGCCPDRVRDLRTPVTCIHAPKARAGIEERPPALVVEMHAFGSREHPRRATEGPICREREP